MMLPMADEGLDEMGVAEAERRHWLGIIQERLETRMTGARWQSDTVQSLEAEMDRGAALQQMLLRYRELNRSGAPVARWPAP